MNERYNTLGYKRIKAARQKYAKEMDIPISEVPWQVVFLSNRPLTEKEKQRGGELEEYRKELEYEREIQHTRVSEDKGVI